MDKKSIIEKLKHESPATLYREACAVRKKYYGKDVFVRGLVEFSNVCVRNCFYCGLRRDNIKEYYQMAPGSIMNTVIDMVNEGFHSIVLQSGDDPDYSRDVVCRILNTIRQLFPSIAITLSIGERPFDDYKAFKDNGADRYLLKIETTCAEHYSALHPGQNIKKRIKILEYLRKIGYQIGTGCIVGLPFQKEENLADDILFFNYLEPDMIAIGPFIPHKNTPLKDQPRGDTTLTLKTIAMARIISKNALMPATAALSSADPENGLSLGLQAGCNVIMANFTPDGYRSKYDIYDNKNDVSLEMIGKLVNKASLTVSLAKGDSFTASGSCYAN